MSHPNDTPHHDRPRPEVSGVEEYVPVSAAANEESYASHRWYAEHAVLIISTLKWVVLGASVGVCVGLGTRAFLLSLAWAANLATALDVGVFRSIYLLPVALPVCVWLIRTFAPSARGHGTEAVIRAVHTNAGRIDLKVAPIKLLASVLTLAFGGSVGKEGPCAQIGAAITSGFADILRLSDEDRRRLVICGIGAGFAAVFGTPISGALFGIEVLYLGRIEYPLLFPCMVAGIVAHLVCGTAPPVAHLHESLGDLHGWFLVLITVAAGLFFGFVALLLIEAMKVTRMTLHRVPGLPYLIATGGGLVLVALYVVFGSEYAGLGSGVIEATMGGAMDVALTAFAIKIVSTTVSLESGGSGGIVTPLFFIGSTAGAAFASVFHLPVGAFAAFGMVSVVAAAANAPIAAAVMGIELVHGSIGVYAALSACTAYLIVGHRSVYPSQVLGEAKSASFRLPDDVVVGEIDTARVDIRPGPVLRQMSKLLRWCRGKRRRR